MSERLVLALDCGSTNLKGALFSQDLALLATASRPVVYAHHGPERYEFGAEEIWQSVAEIAKETCAAVGIALARLTRIAIGSQAQSFLLADGAGRPLTPVFSWLDRTAVAESLLAKERFGGSFHRHCSFAEPIPQLQVCKARKVARECADAPSSMLFSLPGWVAWRLGAGNATDENLAAMGGMYSLAEERWWPVALSYAGLREEQLPRVYPLGAAVGVCRPCAELDLSPHVRIVFAGNDQTCGAYGNGVSEGTVLATLGTALVAYRCTGSRPGPYRPTTFWGPYPGGRHYELATRDEGCLALDWVRGELGSEGTPREFDQAAEAYRPTVDVTSPLFWPARTGVRGGLPATADLGAAAYVTLEGIGFALRELLEQGLGLRHGETTVKLTGGGAKSAVWRQLIADILSCPVVHAHGDSLLGAAAMALGTEVRQESRADRAVPDGRWNDLLERRFERWCRHG